MTKSLYEKPYESRILGPIVPVRVPAPMVVATAPARVAPPPPAAAAPIMAAPPAPKPAKPAKPMDPTQGAPRVLLVGRVVATMVTVLMVCLLARIVQLQVSPPEQLDRLIGSQHSTVELLGRRATITDREGRIVATTGLAHRLYADPKMIADPGTFPELVGYALNMDPAKIGKRLNQMADKRYVVLDQQLTDEQWLKLETMRSKARAAAQIGKPITSADDVQWSRLTGLYTDIWMDRQYPQGPTAGHILGIVNHEGKGVEGAERMYERDLAGTPGKLGYLRDAGHRALDIDLDNYEHAKDGRPIRLSIDITIQSIAESELAKACKEFGAKTGEMVIMDPHTGEIIAMANYPAFDPNEARTTSPEVRRNRCVTDPFEPGSTFKPFIWSLATQQGVARPTDMINTDAFVGRALRDTHDHGSITWAQVLVKSSNKGMAIIGQRMGSTKLYNAVKAFGFGEMTNSGMPGESRGLVNPLRKWNPKFSPTSVPMGQEIAVTPLQLCRAFCVFANGGFLVTPTLKAKDDADPSDPRYAAVVQRVLNPATTQTTKDVMRLVVTEGTGRKADSKQYAIFGKTGTAQVARKDGKGYETGAYNGVFVAGAPLDKPRLVIACVIHKPDVKKGYYGGIVAAPAVMRTFEQTLNYMGVKPNSPTMVEVTSPARVAQR
jgi:cell division protein FtsI/penicillin-binding protein 2